MRLTERTGKKAVRTLWAAVAGIILFGLLPASGDPPKPQENLQTPAAPQGRLVKQRTGQYDISAHLFIIGRLGDVGTMTIGETLRQNEGALEKSLSLTGSANAEQAKKNRDYRGEFHLVEVMPLRPDGSVDEEAVREWRGYEKSCSGILKLKKYQAENVKFFKDHAVATRENGTERTVEGGYDSLLSPLAYFLEHEIKVGDIIETPYILNGKAHYFKSEVTDLVTLSEYKARAFQIDIGTFDKVNTEDKPTKDVWKKQGNIRVWFCKEGPYRNTLLRIKIKFRWYLWLYINLQKLEG